MKTLITFLGRVPKNDGSYRKTRYVFDNHSHTEEVAFFGWALQQRIRPDRFVVFGTSGSMWDHLFEGDLQLGEAAEEARLNLLEDVDAKSVSQAMLDALAPVLSNKLGCAVSLRLLPYGLSESEQVALLQRMADEVPKNSGLHLDITHALRHLPMIGLMAALYLRELRKVKVEKIWYGAYEEDTNQAQVYDLNGLLRIADGIAAMARYHKDGDYSALAGLLGDDGQLLEQAAFYERTTNPVKAREKLTSWINHPIKNTNPVSVLFEDEIKQRISWHKGKNRAEWEKSLAFEYLKRRDFVRAVAFGLEGVISREVVNAGGNLNDYETRNNKREELKHSLDGFKTLNNLRNALLHGLLPSDNKIRKIIRDEQTLYITLKDLLKQVMEP